MLDSFVVIIEVNLCIFLDLHENSCITGFDTPTTGACGNESELAEPNQNGDNVPEASPTNIEWARYLTSIEDIVGDGATGDQGQPNPLDSINITLQNPLENSSNDLQSRLFNAFGLNEFTEMTKTPIVMSTPATASEPMDAQESSSEQKHKTLYLIPFCDVVARYHPFDICKDFVSKLMSQPEHFNKLSNEIRLRTAQRDNITVPFQPKLLRPEPIAELTLKQKLEAIRDAKDIEIPVIGEQKKRPRKIRPVIYEDAKNKRPLLNHETGEIGIIPNGSASTEENEDKAKPNNQKITAEKRRSVRITNVL